MPIQHAILGPLEVQPGEALFVQRDIVLNGVSSRCSVFVGDGLTGVAGLLERALAFIEDLPALDINARQAFRDDHSGTVSGYIEFHLQELPQTALNAMFAGFERQAITAELFLSRLALVGVGLHVAPDAFTVNLDYGPGREHSNQLLVARWDSDGRLELAHES